MPGNRKYGGAKRFSSILVLLGTVSAFFVLFRSGQHADRNLSNSEKHGAKNTREAETTTDANDNHALPGTYNLVKDVAPHNGGMQRPTKQCSLGKE